jgi:threonine aldolase
MQSWVASVGPVETNILIFLGSNCNENLIELLKQKNILISSMGHETSMVTS